MTTLKTFLNPNLVFKSWTTLNLIKMMMGWWSQNEAFKIYSLHKCPCFQFSHGLDVIMLNFDSSLFDKKDKKIALVIDNGQKFFVMWVDMYSILFLCTSSWVLPWVLPWVHIYHVMFHKWQIHMLPNQHPLRLHLHHWNQRDIMLECIVMWTMKLLNLVLACILKHVLKWNGLALKMYFPYSMFVAMILDSFTSKSIFFVWTLCYHCCFIVMCHGFFIFCWRILWFQYQ